MGVSFQDLNKERKSEYKKDQQEEDFLLKMNKELQGLEEKYYRDYDVKYPFIFIFGLPRSGTTLLSQLIAYSLDVGYINNLISRFWLAPVHGIKLSKNLLGDEKKSDFRSNYARTSDITDIHEFGYFWRHWLKKETMADITRVREREKTIDWQGIKRVLANMQNEFGKPMVFKNIYGSYHLKKFQQILGKVLYLHIDRDHLDVAVSILNARQKYYDDPMIWWSYTPIEYDRLKNLDYREQIAGQIFFLNRFYHTESLACGEENVIKIDYQEMCRNPKSILEKIRKRSLDLYDYEIKITNQPPDHFQYRTYQNWDEEKRKFSYLIEKFKKEN